MRSRVSSRGIEPFAIKAGKMLATDVVTNVLMRLRGPIRQRINSASIESFINKAVKGALRNQIIEPSTAVPAGTPVHRIAVGVAVVSDRTIASMNREYRKKKGPTDILSFASSDFGKPGDLSTTSSWFDEEEEGKIVRNLDLGDMFISAAYVEAAAKQLQVPLNEHWQTVLTHGVAHLLGHDHEKDEDYERMKALENDIMAYLKTESKGEEVIIMR